MSNPQGLDNAQESTPLAEPRAGRSATSSLRRLMKEGRAGLPPSGAPHGDAGYHLESPPDCPDSRADGSEEALARALDFLHEQLASKEVPCALISSDPGFQHIIPAPALREWCQEKLGVDLGFDMGEESFSAMLALKLLPTQGPFSDRDLLHRLSALVQGCQWKWRFRFFFNENGFAADTDCTAIAVAALHESGLMSPPELVAAAQELLRAAAPHDRAAGEETSASGNRADGALTRGVLMVYWEDHVEPNVSQRGRKHDAVVCANALYVLKAAQRYGLVDGDGVIERTTQYVYEHLTSGQYLDGTRYYPSPDTFLYAVSRLCRRFRDCRSRFATALRQSLADSEGRAPRPNLGDDPMQPLNLAQRIIAANNVGLEHVQQRWRALLMQQQTPEGGWPPCPFYTLGRYALYFGSSTITTLFAIKALQQG